MITNNISPVYVQIFRGGKIVLHIKNPRGRNFEESVKDLSWKEGDIAFFSPAGNYGAHCARRFKNGQWEIEAEYIARIEAGLIQLT